MYREEYILCAALWIKDGKFYAHQPKNVETGYVICGHRHHNCYNTLTNIRNDNGEYYRSVCTCIFDGFITSKNRFVDRTEAIKVAMNCGQIKKIGRCNLNELFSEDLY